MLEACVFLVPSWQVLIGTDSITNLHKLEQVSSDEGIGTLAENLLEALREHPDVNKKIDAARRETRAEKKRMAMAMRQKALGTLGMTVRPAESRLPVAQSRSSVLWDRAGLGVLQVRAEQRKSRELGVRGSPVISATLRGVTSHEMQKFTKPAKRRC